MSFWSRPRIPRRKSFPICCARPRASIPIRQRARDRSSLLAHRSRRLIRHFALRPSAMQRSRATGPRPAGGCYAASRASCSPCASVSVPPPGRLTAIRLELWSQGGRRNLSRLHHRNRAPLPFRHPWQMPRLRRRRLRLGLRKASRRAPPLRLPERRNRCSPWRAISQPRSRRSSSSRPASRSSRRPRIKCRAI